MGGTPASFIFAHSQHPIEILHFLMLHGRLDKASFLRELILRIYEAGFWRCFIDFVAGNSGLMCPLSLPNFILLKDFRLFFKTNIHYPLGRQIRPGVIHFIDQSH